MERSEALKIVKPHLTEHRYQHTIGVTDTSVMLAKKYGADVKKAEIAAVFHDYAKFRPKEEMRQIIKDQGMDLQLLSYSSELLHAPVGAYLVKTEVGIKDEDILRAIRYHTTGRVGMSLLEKVVFLADYIEPNRAFPGVEEVRKTAEQSLEEAVLQSLKNTVQFLMKQNQLVFPDTIAAYNDILLSIKGK
ncbi:bis(5'-nucleosyl)-tetraphosphatase (symmetrical) YqeK [Bacillus taeanensis]|uniref:bis(5'-nucleosyl)-tetraphosphatase (symmetrical) n=1 Tax=Bacillus taeanensis TaxID=273032 RepID=A0A366Y0B0_9BACI|nr:bis(5'-nucleosyl)-tetraphosphatase (symmetrical) YqeK [Bacillus taeanensis]RBW70479.1 phosphohydrolase [Bacillus taeanensis]